jgi:hypothetical protein
MIKNWKKYSKISHKELYKSYWSFRFHCIQLPFHMKWSEQCTAEKEVRKSQDDFSFTSSSPEQLKIALRGFRLQLKKLS